MADIKYRRRDGQEFVHYDVNTDLTIANFITDEEGKPHVPGTTMTVWNAAANPIVAVAHYVFLGPSFSNKWGKLETPYLV
jgi:hypothetical protein